MENVKIIDDIFNKTNDILHLRTNFGQEYTENPQVSHILNYLCLTACYLKSKEEAEVFKENWDKMKGEIKSGSDEMDWLNQSNMIRSHLEQTLKEESVHNPNDSRNVGVAHFYENQFSHLYKDAKLEYEQFQKRQESAMDEMRKHYEEVHSSTEAWEAALMRGDPAAFCD